MGWKRRRALITLAMLELALLLFAHGFGFGGVMLRTGLPGGITLAGGSGAIECGWGRDLQMLWDSAIVGIVPGWLYVSSAPTPYVWWPSYSGPIASGGGLGDTSWCSVPVWLLILPCLVAQFVIVRRSRAGPNPQACHTCTYDLTGNRSGRCPECGTPIPGKRAG